MSEFNVSVPKQMAAPGAYSRYPVYRFGIVQALTARRCLPLLVILAWLLFAAPSAYAASIILGANCSLANAIRSANGDAQVAPANQCAAGSASGFDLILFVADVEISEALPAITSDMRILGADYSLSTPDDDTEGENTTYDFNLLTVTDGDVYINDLSLSGADDSAIKAEQAANADLKLYISNCDIFDNTAAGSGGGITVDGDADVYVRSTTLRRNKAPNGSGGAVYAKNSSLVILSSVLSENSAGGNGGAVYFETDAAEWYRVLQVQESKFNSNKATDDDDNTNIAENGGAIYVANKGRTANPFNTIYDGAVIGDNSFSENSARNGGAIYAGEGKLNINNNTIDENAASEKGGGIYAAGGPLLIRHGTILKNQAANGGGIAIFTDDQDASQNPKVSLYNSIIADNTDTDTADTTCFRDALTADIGNIIQDSNCPAAQATGASLLLELVNGGATKPNSKADRYYRLLKGSPAIDSGDNGQERVLSSDQVGHNRPQGAGYDIGAYEFMIGAPEPNRGSPGSGPEGGSSDGEHGGTSSQADEMVHTCGPLSEADNGIEISATYGLESGVQCQEIDAAGIGIQWIIDAGFIKAVDIWSYVEQGVRVCFDASGPLLFLDSTTVPKTVLKLPLYILDGKTCASIRRPGSIVLQRWAGEIAQPTALPAASRATQTRCMVTTTAALNLRDAPNGNRIGEIPPSVTLTALSSANGWYKVDWYGQAAWISAAFTIPRGSCG